MDDVNYNKLVSKYTIKENIYKNIVIAFLSGGSIGLFGQLLVDFFETNINISEDISKSLMIVSLIFLSSLLTSIGFFDKLVNFCGCGLIIPITGFAHSMMSSALEYKKEGFIFGIGSNIFKLSGSVILYGVVSTCFIGLIRYIIEVYL